MPWKGCFPAYHNLVCHCDGSVLRFCLMLVNFTFCFVVAFGCNALRSAMLLKYVALLVSVMTCRVNFLFCLILSSINCPLIGKCSVSDSVSVVPQCNGGSY